MAYENPIDTQKRGKLITSIILSPLKWDAYKSLKGSIVRTLILVLIGSILSILTLILFFFVGRYLPTYWAKFLYENFLFIGFTFVIVYQIKKTWKQAVIDKESSYLILRNSFLSPLLLILLCYALYVITYIIQLPTKQLLQYEQYKNCEETTQILGGGWKEIKGEKFFIQMCAARIPDQTPFFGKGFKGKKVRLAVFDQNENLQALGFFQSGGDDLFSIEIREDQINFGDWHSDSSNRIIKLPPSRLEWVLARLPIF